MEIPRYWRLQSARYRLEGSNCSDCGIKHFPERPVCPDCGAGGPIFNAKTGEQKGETIIEQIQTQPQPVEH